MFFYFIPNIGLAAGPTEINWKNIADHQIWTASNSPYVVDGSVTVDFDLVIEPGVIIKMKSWARISFLKKLKAIGTVEDRIIFTSFKDDTFGGDTNRDENFTYPAAGDWNQLNFFGSGEANIEYTGFYYGSAKNVVTGAVFINGNSNVSIRRSEIKYSGYAGLFIYNAQPEIEEDIIANNNAGVIVWNPIGMIAKIASSSIMDNIVGAVILGPVYDINQMRLDARGNWWGDASGPYYQHSYYGDDNLSGLGNNIRDGVIYDPWLGKDPNKKREPIILIPGIGAAVNLDLMVGGLLSDDWTLFDHSYDGIIESFNAMGYERDKDFFICYYDWRQSNASSAKKYLAPLIKKANTLNNSSKVNIVAHSMGGLVARTYIQGGDYDNDVDNLFMIGTPNHGSSDIYPVWEGGYIPKGWSSRLIMKWYSDYLTIKYPTPSKYESIHEYIPAIKELLPIYNYIYPVNEPENMLAFSGMHERNDFLLNLNNDIDVLNERVKVSVFVGTGEATVNSIPTELVVENKLWLDGKPEPIDPVRNDSAGDGRVLMSSAMIDSHYLETLVGSHGAIVSQAEPSIALKINETLDRVYSSPTINDELLIWVASPLDIEIVAPDASVVSATQNNIFLAKYASESKADGVKMILIPNPIDGKYSVNLLGNGDGEYHLGLEYADYSGVKDDASSLVSGFIEKGELSNYIIEYQSDSSNPIDSIRLADDTLPVIEILAPLAEEYLRQGNLEIVFNAFDEDSGIATTSLFLDGQKICTSIISLVKESLGEHTIKVEAIDRAGNIASSSTSFYLIANIGTVIFDINRLYNDGEISKKVLKKLLVKQLQYIKKNSLKNHPKKEKIIKKRYQFMLRQLKFFLHRSWLSQKAYDIIKEDIEYLINDL